MGDTDGRRLPQFVYLADAHATPSYFGWRLTAANRRPLGQGVMLTASLAQCRADAALVRHELDAAITSIVVSIGVEGARWSWRLWVDGKWLAVSARPYVRRPECVRGLTQFTAAVRMADPDAGVLRSYGPHTLRGYEPAR